MQCSPAKPTALSWNSDCRRSWCVSKWQEVYECQPNKVILGECRWQGRR